MRIYLFVLFAILGGQLSAQSPSTQDILDKAKNLFQSNQLDVDQIKSLTTNFSVAVVGDLAVENAFYKDPKIFIPLPDQYNQVKSTVSRFGGERLVNNIEKQLNEAAEATIDMAKPLVVDAVKQLTVTDVIRIAADRQDGFTNYLDDKVAIALQANITPSVKQHLEKTGTYNLLNDFFKNYKRAAGFFGKRIPDGPDLETYVAAQAVKGLFVKLAAQESEFRSEKLPSIFSK